MDLIYTNKNREDVGIFKDYTFDLAFGSDENDFELTLSTDGHCCEANCFVYVENTEYGGIIDRVNVVTTDDKLAYKGRTWHGILASKIILPDTSQTYFRVSGEANGVIRSVIQRIGLTELFEVSTEHSGLTINVYTFDRYVDAYTGLRKMLASVGGKLKFTFKNGKVILSALPLVDYSKNEQFDNDQVEMDIEKVYNTVNHLVCVGKNEDDSATTLPVVHLYRGNDGAFSQTQTFSGLGEIMGVHEYSSQKDMDELLDNLNKGDTDKIKKYVTEDTVQMDFASEETTYDIGDIIGAKEIITEIFATEKITKKIVTITQGLVNIQYKVGE